MYRDRWICTDRNAHTQADRHIQLDTVRHTITGTNTYGNIRPMTDTEVDTQT
jgi:hypothetical protein